MHWNFRHLSHSIKSFFQDDNASYHRVKMFLQERHFNSLTWPANSPYREPIENLGWKLEKQMGSWRSERLTAIRECWNLIVFYQWSACLQEFKARGGATKYRTCTNCVLFFFVLDFTILSSTPRDSIISFPPVDLKNRCHQLSSICFWRDVLQIQNVQLLAKKKLCVIYVFQE